MATDASPSLSAAFASLNPVGRPGMGGARVPESVEQAGDEATDSPSSRDRAASETARAGGEGRSRALEGLRRTREGERSESGSARLDEQGQRVRDQVDQQRRDLALQELRNRDREVRSHEQAHLAAGGQYTSSVSYSFVVGPDGKRYAIGGNVDVDTTPVRDDPEATLDKARQVRAAALAPANPSPQDRQIAAEAAQMAQEARMELRQERQEEQREEVSEEAGDSGRGRRDPLKPESLDGDPLAAERPGAEGNERSEPGDRRPGEGAPSMASSGTAGAANRAEGGYGASDGRQAPAPDSGINLYV
ncbi:putative metalloprotease CJM1_0395 family protein [Thiohalospira sp.]|uniref:putative metalloprotease CJM1_0395 family protein n=1 Tax=Thiohalospira sp. TaxID=3080549 RepID=UPI0039801937